MFNPRDVFEMCLKSLTLNDNDEKNYGIIIASIVIAVFIRLLNSTMKRIFMFNLLTCLKLYSKCRFCSASELACEFQVLNETSLWWFNQTQHITPNAVVSAPDKNVTIAKKCSVFPVEFVGEFYIGYDFFMYKIT